MFAVEQKMGNSRASTLRSAAFKQALNIGMESLSIKAPTNIMKFLGCVLLCFVIKDF